MQTNITYIFQNEITSPLAGFRVSTSQDYRAVFSAVVFVQNVSAFSIEHCWRGSQRSRGARAVPLHVITSRAASWRRLRTPVNNFE